ncbi:MAG: ketosteroid isomerase-like protein [Gammaproteobacteria bacterium]|jgi:ketosteroid isomerase-like protein
MSENQKIVQQWFDHISAGNAEAAFALFSDDIVYDLKGSTPVSGVFQGLDSIVNDFFVPWRKQIDGELTVHIDEIFGEGDKVVALGRGAAKTVFGLPYENDYAFVCTVRDGKICKIIEFLDTALVETAAYGRRLVEP